MNWRISGTSVGVSVVVQIGLVVPVLAGCGVVFYVPAAVARRMLGCEAMLLFGAVLRLLMEKVCS